VKVDIKGSRWSVKFNIETFKGCVAILTLQAQKCFHLLEQSRIARRTEKFRGALMEEVLGGQSQRTASQRSGSINETVINQFSYRWGQATGIRTRANPFNILKSII
jgi:hypothetical protein